MKSKVYVLLDIPDGKYNAVFRALQGKAGVVALEHIEEGPPDIVLTVEAPNRKKLAQLTVSAIASVENMADNFTLLPVYDRFVDSSRKQTIGSPRISWFLGNIPAEIRL